MNLEQSGEQFNPVEGPSDISKEQEGNDFRVVRYANQSGKFNSEFGLAIFRDFTKGLEKENPERDYQDRYKLEVETWEDVNVYVAVKGQTNVVGVAVGERKDNNVFKGLWLLVDPKSTGSVGKRIVRAVQNDFDEIVLDASAFGQKKDSSEKEKFGKQVALERFYERLGFRKIPSDRTAPQMVWKKSEQ